MQFHKTAIAATYRSLFFFLAFTNLQFFIYASIIESIINIVHLAKDIRSVIIPIQPLGVEELATGAKYIVVNHCKEKNVL